MDNTRLDPRPVRHPDARHPVPGDSARDALTLASRVMFVALGVSRKGLRHLDAPAAPRETLRERLGDTVPNGWVDALLALDPAVVAALAGAGMQADDVIALAATLSPDELTNDFVGILKYHLGHGDPASDALAFARYAGIATDEQLADPQFRADLAEGVAKGYTTPQEAVHYARSKRLVAQLDDPSVTLAEVLALAPPVVADLLYKTPEKVREFLALGFTLQNYEDTPIADRDVILAADKAQMAAFAAAGLTPQEAIAVLGKVTPEEATDAAFMTTLVGQLRQGKPVGDAVLWARYADVATAAELSDPAFLKLLRQAEKSPALTSKAERVHDAHAKYLAARTGCDPKEALGLSEAAVRALLKLPPGQVRALLGENVSLRQILQLTPAERTALASAEPALVAALLKAGLTPKQAAAVAGNLTLAEATDAGFMATLVRKLAEGVPAKDAVLWARYAGVATDAELADPNFLRDLERAEKSPDYPTLAERVHYARAETLISTWPAKVQNEPGLLDRVLALSDAQIARLKGIGAAEVQGLRSIYLNLQQIAGLTPDERKALLAADPKVVRALLRAGMSAHDVAALAGQVTAAEVAAPGFIDTLRTQLANGLAAPDALIWARYSGIATDEELADPAFRQALANGPPAESRDILYKRWRQLVDAGYENMPSFEEWAARANKPEVSKAAAVHWARADLLKRRLDVQDSTESLSKKLSDEQLLALLAVDPATLKSYLAEQGVTLDDLLALTPEQIANLAANVPAATTPGSGFLSYVLQLMLALTSNKDLGSVGLASAASLTAADFAKLRQAQAEGYTVLPPDQSVKPEDIVLTSVQGVASIGGGMVMFETKDGRKLIISKDTQPDLYNALMTLVDADLRSRYGITSDTSTPATDELTTQLIDPSDPSKGYYTVGQLTIKTLMDKYRGMLDKGEITKDDPRAKLLFALEARDALTNGYWLYPYVENDGFLGIGTYRSTDQPVFMTPADVAAIIDPQAVDAQIQQLMGDSTVKTDYAAATATAVAARPDSAQDAETLFGEMTNGSYAAALKELNDRGLSAEATAMTQRDLQYLATLDPAKATEAAQALIVDGVGIDYQALLSDPSLVSVEDFEQAITDAIKIALQSIRSSTALTRHGAQSVTSTINYLEGILKDKTSVHKLAVGLREMVIAAHKSGVADASGAFSGTSAADIRALMDKTYLPAAERGMVTRFFTETQRVGLWGTIAGGAVMASFAYKLTQGAWSSDSSAIERWGAARDLLALLSVNQHAQKLGATVVDYFKQLLGTGSAGDAWAALGLDKTLPQVWGQRSFLPGQQNWNEVLADSRATMWDQYDSFRNSQGAPEAIGLDLNDPTTKAAVDRFNARLEQEAAAVGMRITNSGSRLAVSFFKVMGSVTDLVGVADIVLGAMGIAKGVAAGDNAAIVANSLGMAGGAALTAAGTIGTLGLFGAVGVTAMAAVAPLFLVGAVLAAAGFAIQMIWGAIDEHRKMQQLTDGQGEWFQDLANQGLTFADWGDKLEYLRYAFHTYGGNDNTNDAQSYFDFQAAEWAHFRDTPPHDGSSINRLDWDLHVYTDESHDPRKDQDPTDGAMS